MYTDFPSEQKFLGTEIIYQKNKNWMWTELQVNNFHTEPNFRQ